MSHYVLVADYDAEYRVAQMDRAWFFQDVQGASREGLVHFLRTCGAELVGHVAKKDIPPDLGITRVDVLFVGNADYTKPVLKKYGIQASHPGSQARMKVSYAQGRKVLEFALGIVAARPRIPSVTTALASA